MYGPYYVRSDTIYQDVCVSVSSCHFQFCFGITDNFQARTSKFCMEIDLDNTYNMMMMKMMIMMMQIMMVMMMLIIAVTLSIFKLCSPDFEV